MAKFSDLPPEIVTLIVGMVEYERLDYLQGTHGIGKAVELATVCQYFEDIMSNRKYEFCSWYFFGAESMHAKTTFTYDTKSRSFDMASRTHTITHRKDIKAYRKGLSCHKNCKVTSKEDSQQEEPHFVEDRVSQNT